MTKQEAKRYIHETYSNTELYPEAVKQFREFEGDWEGYRKRKEELDMISESCVAEAKQKTPTLPNKMTYEQTKRYHLMRCTKTGYIDELEVGKPCEITLDERLAYINHKLGNILKNAHTIEMLLGLMKEEE